MTEQNSELIRSLNELKEKSEGTELLLETQQEQMAVELAHKEGCIKENESSLEKLRAEIEKLNESITKGKEIALNTRSELDESVSEIFSKLLVDFGEKFPVQTPTLYIPHLTLYVRIHIAYNIFKVVCLYMHIFRFEFKIKFFERKIQVNNNYLLEANSKLKNNNYYYPDEDEF